MPEELKKIFLDSKKNFEIMNSLAAYNTHNVLLTEKRNFVSVVKLV